jgi:hypothetical protein
MQNKICATKITHSLAVSTQEGTSNIKLEAKRSFYMSGYKGNEAIIFIAPENAQEEITYIKNVIAKILKKDPEAFSDRAEAVQLIEHLIFTFRTRSLEKKINKMFKTAISELEKELGRPVQLTTHRRRGGGDDLTKDSKGKKIRGSKTRIEFKLRKPTEFATEENGHGQNNDFNVGTQRPYIAFFLHAMPNNFGDLSEGFEYETHTFRYAASQAIDQRMKDNILYYLNKSVVYDFSMDFVLQNGDFHLFVKELVGKLDEIIEGQDAPELQEFLKERNGFT